MEKEREGGCEPLDVRKGQRVPGMGGAGEVVVVVQL